jgi:hypothetical protein
MDTRNPLLYITFQGGRFKLEGTFVYPMSRYTVLKLGSRQSVQLEHAFEHIVRPLPLLKCIALCAVHTCICQKTCLYDMLGYPVTQTEHCLYRKDA